MVFGLSRIMSLLPYELVDIGANLTHGSFKKDFSQVLERAKKAGIKKIMVTGVSEKLSEDAAKLVENYPGFLYFTAGVHPHDAKDFNDSTSLDLLRKLASHRQCVAVGECGLDFNRNFSPQDVQKKVFEEQVGLAVELQKPLFIHEREAFTDMNLILDKFDKKPKLVIHCFTGTAEELEGYVKKGYYIGLTGFLWKDKSENGVKYALSNGLLPLNRLLLETDAPYMYPKVNDKKIPAVIREKYLPETIELHKHASFDRNEPCALAATCELIAGYMNIDPIEVARQTTQNAKDVYGLDL